MVIGRKPLGSKNRRPATCQHPLDRLARGRLLGFQQASSDGTGGLKPTEKEHDAP